jgi:NAD(P)-dependent dehydrogenase (short-subunit alcohol dehydrogenase family)
MGHSKHSNDWRLGATPRTPPAGWLGRIKAATWQQAARSLGCPSSLRLDGKLALVTGGNAGIGLATCRGLLRHGAEVVMLSRDAARAERACDGLRDELGAESAVSFERLDLSDLGSVRDGTRALADRLGERRVDVLVCNAGVWPQRYGASAQGFEIAFATNVLGHYVLLRRSLERMLSHCARIVMVTGDIYTLARDCTPDYRYHTPLGGMLAYCRSKLGNHWLAAQLQRERPALEVIVVHPGVVASDLGGSGGSLGKALRQRMTIDPDRGAQTSVYAAVQPGLPKGAYLHNTLGLLRLRDDDPARDCAGAGRLWAQCERLCREFV